MLTPRGTLHPRAVCLGGNLRLALLGRVEDARRCCKDAERFARHRACGHFPRTADRPDDRAPGVQEVALLSGRDGTTIDRVPRSRWRTRSPWRVLGPDFVDLVLSQVSLRTSVATAIWTSIGVGAAISLQRRLSLLGLGLLIKSFGVTGQRREIAGAAYIAWLGVQSLRANRRGSFCDRRILHRSAASTIARFSTGFFTTLSQPQSLPFFLSLFGVSFGRPPRRSWFAWLRLVDGRGDDGLFFIGCRALYRANDRAPAVFSGTAIVSIGHYKSCFFSRSQRDSTDGDRLGRVDAQFHPFVPKKQRSANLPGRPTRHGRILFMPTASLSDPRRRPARDGRGICTRAPSARLVGSCDYAWDFIGARSRSMSCSRN